MRRNREGAPCSKRAEDMPREPAQQRSAPDICSSAANQREKDDMDAVFTIFGEGKDLNALQAAMRAIVVFVCALLLIRISGRRSFGQRSPFDYVVAILLGAIMSRVVVGASPVIPTLAASLVIVLAHRALAWACVRSRPLERLVVGAERKLYSGGHFDDEQMSAALVSQTDIFQTVREKLGAADLSGVHAAILECNGEISLIRKSDQA
jgi:uncharacterized membrane protein YcaP (DUF421 family)